MKSKMKLLKGIIAALLSLIVLCTAAVFAAYFYLRDASSARDEAGGEKSFHFRISSGMTPREAAAELYKNEIIKNENVFYLFARFPELGELITKAPAKVFTIKTGICDLSSAMDAASIYKALSAGRDEQIQLSIPEGLTISKIASRLEKAEVCSAEDFSAAAHDKDFLQSLNIPFESAEGYLFPDTYSFVPGSSAKNCVEAMINNFFDRTSSIEGFSSMTQEERERVVILASIIEREYRIADEAPVIASVFSNRIKNHIGLYSCATVEYVITEILGRPHPDIITYDDLKIQSPYNTYLNEGLPPGPISNPGLVALNAAANPADTPYFYFRLTDEAEGRHVFTKTFQEHIDEGVIFNTKKVSR